MWFAGGVIVIALVQVIVLMPLPRARAQFVPGGDLSVLGRGAGRDRGGAGLSGLG